MRGFSNKLLIILCIGTIIVLGGKLFSDMRQWTSFSSIIDNIEKLPDLAHIIVEPIISVDPLIIENDSQNEPVEYILTADNIFNLTNQQRSAYEIPLLSRNALLDYAAQLKMEDMFAKQYFAHDSPQGDGIEVSVKKANYKYILVGENLALGDFENELELVEGWMNSPGHRENILNESYREIGIATRSGQFNGQNTWLAVQIFGRALDDCPAPDEQILALIEFNKNSLEDKYIELQNAHQNLENIRPRRGEYYQQLVEDYNYLVGEYNLLNAETEGLIEGYNRQVEEFNLCLEEI